MQGSWFKPRPQKKKK